MSVEPSLGTYLRGCREQSGLSVDAISSASRILPQFILALETDRFDRLPAPVYIRGFIRAYCEEVGVDPETALRRYDADVASHPSPSFPAPPPAPRPTARRLGPATMGAALLVALAIAVVFLAVRERQPHAGASRGTVPTAAARPSVPESAPVSAAPAPSAAETPGAAPSAPTAPSGPVATPGPAAPVPPVKPAEATPAAATPAGPSERVLLVRAVDTAWVRVVPDGAPASEATLAPGAVRQWRSAGRFRVSLGNAGGVEIELDGQPLPPLGQRGQVVHVTIPVEAQP